MVLDRGKRRKPSLIAQLKDKWMKIILFIFMVICLYAMSSHLRNVTYFPIKEVKIVGALHTNHTQLQQLVAPLVNRGFFAVDVTDIKDQLTQFPWVARSVVQRVWPNDVFIKLIEKTPVAYWNQASILSAEGQLFHPPEPLTDTSLPIFIGEEGKQAMMLAYYKKMTSLFEPLHFKISRLELTKYASWQVTFDNGIKLIGNNKDFLTRLDHFVKLYPKIVADRPGEIEYIDLRYSNGLAVKRIG